MMCRNVSLLIDLSRGTLAWGLIQQFTPHSLWMCCHDLFGEHLQPAGLAALPPPPIRREDVVSYGQVRGLCSIRQ